MNTLYKKGAVLDFKSGLGNMIHTTPALQYLFKRTGKRVKVCCRKEYIMQCFQDADFLEFVPKSELDDNNKVYWPNYDPTNKQNDYEYIFRHLTGQTFSGEETPYIDRPKSVPKKNQNYLVLLNGGNGANEKFIEAKKMTREMLESVFFIAQEFNVPVVFLGNNYDYDTSKKIMPDFDDYCHVVLNDIRMALNYIDESSGVIANDTGLYHAACAMLKKVIVSGRVPIRGNQKHSRCIHTMNPNCEIVRKINWNKKVHDFIQGFQHLNV